MKQLTTDNCCYYKKTEDGFMIAATLVDDLLTIGSTRDLKNFVQGLKGRYTLGSIKYIDDGPLHYDGMKLERKPSGGISVNQSAYIRKVVETFEMNGSRPRTMPHLANDKLVSRLEDDKKY